MLAGPVRAQSTLTPDEYNALVTAVESTPSQPASEAPIFGNFYTITHGESWPPLPSDTMGLNFWSLGGNYYLLDDRGFGYGASRADASFEPPPSLTNVGSGGSGGNPYFTPPVYTTNDLVLSNKSVIDGVDNLIIYPPSTVTNGVYNVLYTTNPATPLPWEWLMQTAPGQTSVFVTNATDPLGFYRLGPQSYWLVFPNMVTSGDVETLSLYITSTVGASGRVVIPGQANGPVLTVANTNSDPAVLGTYTLTNASLNPATYLLSGAPVSSYYVKGQYLIFYDEALELIAGINSVAAGWVLVDSTSSNLLYNGNYGDFFLNDLTWSPEGDLVSSIAPTTSCAVVPSVQPFSITGGSATNISIPNSVLMTSDGTVDTNTAIAVTADAPVSVYAVRYEEHLTAAFTVYPASLLGTNYCVLAWPSYFGSSEFAIVATADNTTVQITASTNANLDIDETNISLVLQAGQSYEARSGDVSGDVTGTIITSDKPIAVFAGATDDLVPNADTEADNPLVQEQFPVDEWGTNALSLSFAGRSGGDNYRLLTAQNDTVVAITGTILTSTNEAFPPWSGTTSEETMVITNKAGQFVDIAAEGSVEFVANKPLQVAHLGNGYYFDNLHTQEGDPCQIILPQNDRLSKTNIIVTLGTDAGDFDENYLTLVVPELAITNTTLDGTNIPPASFTNIGASGYYGARVTLGNTNAVHAVISSQPILVEAYGWGQEDGYGYSGSVAK